MKYLTKVVESYRLANENEAEEFLKELKQDSHFTVVKYSSTKKQKKAQGAMVDEWIHFEVTKAFNDEKEPDGRVDITYTREGEF